MNKVLLPASIVVSALITYKTISYVKKFHITEQLYDDYKKYDIFLASEGVGTYTPYIKILTIGLALSTLSSNKSTMILIGAILFNYDLLLRSDNVKREIKYNIINNSDAMEYIV